MNETEGFAALLRCDGCQQLVEVPLDERQAKVYVNYIEHREWDAAMNVLRQPGIYPAGWLQRPEIVQRDTLFLDRRTGSKTTSTAFVPAFLDFCPDCIASLSN